MSAAERPWRHGDACVIVRVRLTPKSSKDTIDGVETTADGPALRVRVRAVPAEGHANAAVAKLLADWLGVPKTCVALVGGGKSRVKSLCVAGDPAFIEARLLARLDSVRDAQKTRTGG